MKKLLCLVLTIVFTMSMLSLPRFSGYEKIDSGQNDFKDSIAKTKIFDYIDRQQFENGNYVARLEESEELNTYVFLNSDGTETMYLLAENVKFEAEDGQIREKDISLSLRNNVYVTEDNDVELVLPKYVGKGIEISKANTGLLFKPYSEENSKAVFNEEDNTVSYDNVFGTGMSIVYTPTLTGVKEDIILPVVVEENKFCFNVETELGFFEVDGKIYFAECKDAKTKIELGKVIVYDSEGKTVFGEIEVQKSNTRV